MWEDMDKESEHNFEDRLQSIHRIDDLGIHLASILELDELEAHLYLNLLRIGPITASALAKELHIDRTKAYRVIEKLLQMQIVSTTLSKPKLCVANKPEDVLQAILKKKENQVKQIKKSQSKIIQKINETIPTNYTSSLPVFHVIQGTSNIYSEIEKLIENSTSTVFLVTTLKDLSRMYHTNIPEKVKICEKNGGRVNLLTSIENYDMVPFVSRFRASETRIGNIGSNGRIIVEECREMIMSDSIPSNANKGVEMDFAINTNSIEMVNNIYTLCSLLWENSKHIKIPNLQLN